MKLGTLSLLFISVIVITSCKKEVLYKTPFQEIKKYQLKSPAGDVAGNFTIGSDKDGASVVTIELNKKSNRHGTTYIAGISTPDRRASYAKLEDVNAVIGYSETVNVTEEASGKILTADELAAKHQFQVRITGSTGDIAYGVIP